MASKKKFEIGFNLSAALSPAYSGTMGKASKQMAKLGATIKAAETGQKGIKRFQSLKVGINDTKTVLVAARIKAAALKKEFGRTAKPTKKLSAQMAAAHKNVHKLEGRLKTQRRTLGETKSGLDRAGISTKNLTTQNNRLATSIEKSQAAQGRLNRMRAKRAGAKGKMGAMAGRAAGAAIATGAVFGIPIFSSAMLNAEISNVQALSGATQVEAKKMRILAGHLGDSTTFSARQAAEGMSYLSMAGFKVNETMAAMPGLLNVAKASGEDLGTTADIASNILSGFAIPAAQMGRVGDILTQTFTSSNTKLADLGETMKMAAPMAKLLGVSLEETAAMAGLLASVGIKGSSAGTGIQATMSRLAAPKGLGQDAMASLGVNARDDMGNARNVIEVLGDLSSAMEGMGSAEQASYLKDIFGQEHFKTAASLMEKGTVAIRKYHTEIKNAHKNGKAALTAKIMDDNEIGRLKGLTSAADGLARLFGDKLTPTVNGSLTAATNLTRGFTSFLKTHETLAKGLAFGIPIIGGVTIAAFSLGAAIAATSFAVAGLATIGPVFAGIGAAMTALAPILAGVKFAFLAINTAIIANPIGVAVAALVGGAVLVYKYWEPISAFFSGLWDKIVGIVSKLSIVSKIGGLFKGAFGGDEEKSKLAPAIGNKGNGNIPLKKGGLFGGNKGYVNGLVQKTSKLQPGKGSNSISAPMTAHIAISAGTTYSEAKKGVQDGLKVAHEQWESCMDSVMANERRLAFD